MTTRRPYTGGDAPIEDEEDLSVLQRRTPFTGSNTNDISYTGGWAARTGDSVLRRTDAYVPAVTGLARKVAGDDAAAAEDFARFQQLEEQARAMGPAIQSFDDAAQAGGGLDDYGAALAYQAAGLVPDMALSVIGGGLAGVAAKQVAGGIARRSARNLIEQKAETVALREAAERTALAGVKDAADEGAVRVAKAQAREAVDDLVMRRAVIASGRSPRARAAASAAERAGQFAGATAGQFPGMTTSDVDFLSQEGRTAEDAQKVALGTLGASAIGALPFDRFFGRFGAAAKGEVAKNAERFLPRVAKEFGKQGLAEGSAEAAQAATQLAGHKWVDDNIDLLSPDAVNEYLANFAGGFIVGGALGGAGEVGRAVPDALRGFRDRTRERVGKLADSLRAKREQVGKAMDDLDQSTDGRFRRAYDTVGEAAGTVKGKAKSLYDRFFNTHSGIARDEDVDLWTKEVEDYAERLKEGRPFNAQHIEGDLPVPMATRLQTALMRSLKPDSDWWGDKEAAASLGRSLEKVFRGEKLDSDDQINLFALTQDKNSGISRAMLGFWADRGPEFIAQNEHLLKYADDTPPADAPEVKVGKITTEDDARDTLDAPEIGEDSESEFTPGMGGAGLPPLSPLERLVNAKSGTPEHAALQAEVRADLERGGFVEQEGKAEQFDARAKQPGYVALRTEEGQPRRLLDLGSILQRVRARTQEQLTTEEAMIRAFAEMKLAGIPVDVKSLAPGEIKSKANGQTIAVLTPRIVAGLKNRIEGTAELPSPKNVRADREQALDNEFLGDDTSVRRETRVVEAPDLERRQIKEELGIDVPAKRVITTKEELEGRRQNDDLEPRRGPAGEALKPPPGRQTDDGFVPDQSGLAGVSVNETRGARAERVQGDARRARALARIAKEIGVEVEDIVAIRAKKGTEGTVNRAVDGYVELKGGGQRSTTVPVHLVGYNRATNKRGIPLKDGKGELKAVPKDQRFEHGVEVGLEQLEREFPESERNGRMQRLYDKKKLDLLDPETGLALNYFERALKGEFDEASVREQPWDKEEADRENKDTSFKPTGVLTAKEPDSKGKTTRPDKAELVQAAVSEVPVGQAGTRLPSDKPPTPTEGFTPELKRDRYAANKEAVKAQAKPDENPNRGKVGTSEKSKLKAERKEAARQEQDRRRREFERRLNVFTTVSQALGFDPMTMPTTELKDFLANIVQQAGTRYYAPEQVSDKLVDAINNGADLTRMLEKLRSKAAYQNLLIAAAMLNNLPAARQILAAYDRHLNRIGAGGPRDARFHRTAVISNWEQKWGDFERLARDMHGSSVAELLAKMLDAPDTTPTQRALIKALSKSKALDKVQFRYELTLHGPHYDPNTRSVVMSMGFRHLMPPAFVSRMSPAEVILHEAVHALTAVGEQTDSKLRHDLGILLEHARVEARKLGVDLSIHYGMSDTQEFLAEAFANSEFQDLLRKLPARNLPNQSMWEQFKQWIAKLLNLPSKDINTALEQVLGLGVALGNVSAKATLNEGSRESWARRIESYMPEPEYYDPSDAEIEAKIDEDMRRKSGALIPVSGSTSENNPYTKLAELRKARSEAADANWKTRKELERLEGRNPEPSGWDSHYVKEFEERVTGKYGESRHDVGKEIFDKLPPAMRPVWKQFIHTDQKWNRAAKEAEKYLLDNEQALARHPEAMRHYAEMMRKSASVNPHMEGTARGINADLMAAMFEHHGDDAWRQREIAGKKRRLAQYEEAHKNDARKPGFINMIKAEIKALEDNDLQSMIDMSYEGHEEYMDRVPKPDLKYLLANKSNLLNPVSGILQQPGQPPRFSFNNVDVLVAYVRDQIPLDARQKLTAVFERQNVRGKIKSYIAGIAQSGNLPPRMFLDLMDDAKTGQEHLLAFGYLAWQDGAFEVGGNVSKGLQIITDDLFELANIASDAAYAHRILGDIATGRITNNPRYDVRAAETRMRGFAQKRLANITRAVIDKIDKPLATFWKSNVERMWESGIPAMREFATLIQRPHGTTTEDHDNGLTPAIRAKLHTFQMRGAKLMAGLSAREQIKLFDRMQRQLPPLNDGSRVDVAQKAIARLMDDAFFYIKEAGVKNIGRRPDFFPVVFDVRDDRIAGKLRALYAQPKFENAIRDVLGHWEHDPQADEQVWAPSDRPIAELVENLVSGAAGEPGPARTGANAPRFAGAKYRLSSFVYELGDANDIKTFAAAQTKDPAEIFARYFEPMVKNAEWTRRFGNGKKEALYDKARQQGATDEDIEFAENALEAALGTYGADGSPTLKALSPGLAARFSGKKTKAVVQGLQAYQNARLLPLALLSSIVDPLGIAVRTGGDFRTAWEGFKAGFRTLTNKVDQKELADMMATIGSVDDMAVHEMLAGRFGAVEENSTAQKVNDFVFKWNGMSTLVRTTRYMALVSGHAFLLKHSTNPSEHSARYLSELGLKPGDITATFTQPGPGGTPRRVVTTLSGSERRRLSQDASQGDAAAKARLEADDRVRAALIQFVDEAILRPNSQQAPLWHSDPYMGLVSQYKSFAYAIYDQIGGRIGREFKEGNPSVLWAAAAYLPVALVAELLRELIQYGMGGNPKRESWGVAEYGALAAERTGLMGPRVDIVTDVRGDIQRDKLPGTSQLGPSANQLNNWLDAFEGRRDLGQEFESSLPASAAWRRWNDDNSEQAPPEPV